MRVYVAGPMSGHAGMNRPAFESAAATLRSHGHEPFIPHDIDPADHDGPCPTTYAAAQSSHDSACYLRADLIAMLQRADAVYFLPGWRHSRGARHERYVCEAVGIPIWEGILRPGSRTGSSATAVVKLAKAKR